MNSTTLQNTEVSFQCTTSRTQILQAIFAGAMMPLSFSPFHLPGLAFLSFALLFSLCKSIPWKHAFRLGFLYGISFFGIGVSWVYVSIHQYGHLHGCVAAAISLLFITYLSLYTGIFAVCAVWLAGNTQTFQRSILFSALWCLFEYFRAIFLGGFPWLSVGFGQIDSPLQHLLPILGVPGVGFVTCFLSCLLASAIQKTHRKSYLHLCIFVLLLLSPLLLQQKTWTQSEKKPISVGVIQANLSMRDKWDEAFFWKMLSHYHEKIEQLIHKKTELIVLPESAIPIPSVYISDFLASLDHEAQGKNSAILLGIPVSAENNPDHLYNAMVSLGHADGVYFKQHLVVFGEFVPAFLSWTEHWLALPPNLLKGPKNQKLIQVQEHQIASLICYELAFPELLRKQLPQAEWIVSVSDDGWFGHSLAVFQHVQMAQVLSKQTGRYQVLANNDGLSAIIQDNGEIQNILPAFSSGLLEGTIFSHTGHTPWSIYGDIPFLILFCLIVLFHLLKPPIAHLIKRRYPNTLVLNK